MKGMINRAIKLKFSGLLLFMYKLQSKVAWNLVEACYCLMFFLLPISRKLHNPFFGLIFLGPNSWFYYLNLAVPFIQTKTKKGFIFELAKGVQRLFFLKKNSKDFESEIFIMDSDSWNRIFTSSSRRYQPRSGTIIIFFMALFLEVKLRNLHFPFAFLIACSFI